MSLTCVIVDDAAFVREIYYYSLSELTNIRIVAEAHDGEQAIKVVEALKPDLLILDLVLPLKNGLEVLSLLPSVSPNTKVIVVSSLDDENTKTKASALGALDYIKKPFTKQALQDSVLMVTAPYDEVQNG